MNSEGPLSDKEFAQASRVAAQTTHMLAVTRLAEVAGTPDLDPEIAIKIFNATKDVAGAVPDKKADPYGTLPVFHIHFANGGVVSTGVTPAVELIDGDDVLDMEVPAYAKSALTNNKELLDVVLEQSVGRRGPPRTRYEVHQPVPAAGDFFDQLDL